MKVKEAAKLLGKSEQFIRIGLQRGILPFGYAVKMSSKWCYHISEHKVLEYLGKEKIMAKFKIGDKVRIIKTRHKSNSHYRKTKNHTGTVKFIPRGNWSKYGVEVDGVKNPLSSYGYFYYDTSELEAVEQKQSKFKVGDKVRAKNDTPYLWTTDGWIGIVTSADEYRFSAEGKLPDNDTYNFRGLKYQHFDLVEDQKIVITTDGRVTKATMYEGKQKVKTAEAKCSPSDTFDFNYGASLALERLTGQKYGKVETTLKSKSFDWDGFKAGKFNVVVNRDNIDRFLEECEAHGINWPRNKATEWNPIKKMDAEPDFIMLMLKAVLDFESTDKCDLKVEDGNLKYSFSSNVTEKTVIYD